MLDSDSQSRAGVQSCGDDGKPGASIAPCPTVSSELWKLRLSVSGVMALGTFWQKTFTSSLPPPGERGTAGFRAHPGAKTVLAFPGPFGGLIGALHRISAAGVWERLR